MLELTNARARLSRTESKGTPFSALGEFCWYLSGRGDYKSIEYYLKDAYDPKEDVEADGSVSGAYGPRLIGPRDDDQLERVVTLLKRKETTRRAVLQLFDADDLRTGQHDVPCTCTIQFLNREQRLELVTYMRSNDAYKGLPHDVFCFTLLQEWVARRLGVDVGVYKHTVGSLHLYNDDVDRAKRYLDEGFQSTLSPMPPMPTREPQAALAALLDAEEALRISPPDFGRAAAKEAALDGYWGDLVRLLRAYRYWKDGNAQAILQVRDSMASPIYYHFLDRKARNAAVRSSR
ncbi:MAG TPA: thymidylate synthase [Gemmatimonadaceae bacterium]|nr:thymidylate synthase [Gemmatimonadaceae bacterium]